MLDRLDDEDAEHFAEVRRAARPARGSTTSVDGDPGPRPRLLHAHRVRVRVRARSTRRRGRSAAAGATTAWSRRSAARRPRAAAGRPGSSGSCWRSTSRRAEPTADVFVAGPEASRARAFALVRELRGAGLRAELDLAGRSLKGQMKQADRLGARRAVILDDDGAAEVRDMASGEQARARALERAGGALDRGAAAR